MIIQPLNLRAENLESILHNWQTVVFIVTIVDTGVAVGTHTHTHTHTHTQTHTLTHTDSRDFQYALKLWLTLIIIQSFSLIHCVISLIFDLYIYIYNIICIICIE